MPPEFDPAWEYFVPDPEIEQPAATGFDGSQFGSYRLIRSVTCARCKVPFAGRTGATYCSKTCRGRSTPQRPPVTHPPGRCQRCGGCLAGRRRRFCSDRCSNRFHVSQHKGRSRSGYRNSWGS